MIMTCMAGGPTCVHSFYRDKCVLFKLAPSADVQDTELLGVDDFEYDELEWWLLGVVGTYAVALAVVKFVSAVQDRVFCRVWQGIQKVYAKEQRRLRLDRVVSRSSMRMLDGKATSPTSANSHARKLSGGRLQREARAKRAHAMEMTWLGRQLSPRSSLGSGSDSPFEEEDMTAPAMVFRKIDMDAKGFLVEEDIEMLVQLVGTLNRNRRKKKTFVLIAFFL